MEDAVPAERRGACRESDLLVLEVDRLDRAAVLAHGDRDSRDQDVLQSHGQQDVAGRGVGIVSLIDASGSRVPWTANLARSGVKSSGALVTATGSKVGAPAGAPGPTTRPPLLAIPRSTVKASKQREASRRTR